MEAKKTTISKNQTAKVSTKNGKEYSYKYVDIAQIHDYLEANNMSYYQYIDRIDNDDYIMTVKVIDGKESQPLRGSRVVDATLFGTDNPAQKQGSALTYARRYSLLMAFGLATEDDDGQILSKPRYTVDERFELLKEYNELVLKTDTNPESIYEYYKVENNSQMTNQQLKEANALMKKKAEKNE